MSKCLSNATGWAVLITGCSAAPAHNDFFNLPRYLRREAEEVRWVMSEQQGCFAVPLALRGLTSISIAMLWNFHPQIHAAIREAIRDVSFTDSIHNVKIRCAAGQKGYLSINVSYSEYKLKNATITCQKEIYITVDWCFPPYTQEELEVEFLLDNIPGVSEKIITNGVLVSRELSCLEVHVNEAKKKSSCKKVAGRFGNSTVVWMELKHLNLCFLVKTNQIKGDTTLRRRKTSVKAQGDRPGMQKDKEGKGKGARSEDPHRVVSFRVGPLAKLSLRLDPLSKGFSSTQSSRNLAFTKQFNGIYNKQNNNLIMNVGEILRTDAFAFLCGWRVGPSAFGISSLSIADLRSGRDFTFTMKGSYEETQDISIGPHSRPGSNETTRFHYIKHSQPRLLMTLPKEHFFSRLG
ncbi:hypothetical protein EK904_009486 [Melospiza melodia maxima]|nr:hypothetical protein EK904_009486 [Melospiza melodia maxima]